MAYLYTPDSFSDYSKEIYDSMLLKEVEQTETIHREFSRLSEKSIASREILIDWLIQVVDFSGLPQDVLALSIHIIDTALPRMASDPSLLQLLGVAAFRLAAKYESRITLPLTELVHMGGSCFDKAHVLAMESALLKLLDYNLTTALSNHFLDRLVSLTGSSEDTKRLGNLILETALLSGSYTSYLPSCLAASAMTLANMILKNRNWQAQIQQHSGYTSTHLIDCLSELCLSTFHQVIQEDLHSISVKYGLSGTQSSRKLSQFIQNRLMDIMNAMGL